MAEPNNGLMKKTKTQLVEIILRKDEVERECRTEISNLNEKLKSYNTYIDSTTEQLNADKSIIDKQANLIIEKENLIESLKSQFDIAATEVAEAKENVRMYKDYIRICGTIAIVLIAALICKLFMF